MDIKEAFRELRKKWFYARLYSHSHERVWEDEDQESLREENNNKYLEKYNRDTELIILGENKPIAPSCGFELFNETSN